MKGLLLTGIGFVVGVGEALIYYNMGQAQYTGSRFRIPPTREFLKTAGMVLVTSIVTTAMFKGIEMLMEPEENKDKKAG